MTIHTVTVPTTSTTGTAAPTPPVPPVAPTAAAPTAGATTPPPLPRATPRGAPTPPPASPGPAAAPTPPVTPVAPAASTTGSSRSRVLGVLAILALLLICGIVTFLVAPKETQWRIMSHFPGSEIVVLDPGFKENAAMKLPDVRAVGATTKFVLLYQSASGQLRTVRLLPGEGETNQIDGGRFKTRFFNGEGTADDVCVTFKDPLKSIPTGFGLLLPTAAGAC